MGRVFETPNAVFTDEMLRPEQQGRAEFAAGVQAIVEAQTRAAHCYFEDGSVDAACPPLKAVLHIMDHGNYDGMALEHPTIRGLFTRDSMLESNWYRARLVTKQQRDLVQCEARLHALAAQKELQPKCGLDIAGRLELAHARLLRVKSPAYLAELTGTLGADPFYLQTTPRT
jgi:hypothetical protein